MAPFHAIAAAFAALAGVGHVSPAHAAKKSQTRPSESVTFALPAHHRDPLVAFAHIHGHTVRLSRPKVHGRHAVSRLTAPAMIKARIERKASRVRGIAQLFAHGHEIAQTRFTVPPFGQSATRRFPGHRAGNGASTSPGTTTTPTNSPSTTVSPSAGTGTTTGTTTTIGTTGGGLSGTAGPLIWAPPILTNPTTVDVKSGLDPDVLNLSTSQDYILKMPATADIGTIQINGGHNVVLIGGQVTVPSTANQTDNGADDTDTAIYVKGSTGTVHIEGMLINGQGNTMFDGIDINAPQATVQVENVRVTGLWGSYTSEHADAIQTWGGVKVLRVDDFTADGDYQGLTLKPDIGSIGFGQFQNVDLTADPWPAVLASKSSGGGIMLWLTTGTCTTTPMSFANVYVNNLTDRIPSGNTVWPTTTSTTPCAAKQTGNAVSWPGLPAISGSVTLGAPPNGSFVPAGTVGVGYATPGYVAP